MAEITYRIFFPSAYFARRAFNMMRGAGAVLVEIQRVTPFNGRMWQLVVKVPSSSQAARFIAPEIRSTIVAAINQYDGQFAGNQYQASLEG